MPVISTRLPHAKPSHRLPLGSVPSTHAATDGVLAGSHASRRRRAGYTTAAGAWTRAPCPARYRRASRRGPTSRRCSRPRLGCRPVSPCASDGADVTAGARKILGALSLLDIADPWSFFTRTAAITTPSRSGRRSRFSIRTAVGCGKQEYCAGTEGIPKCERRPHSCPARSEQTGVEHIRKSTASGRP